MCYTHTWIFTILDIYNISSSSSRQYLIRSYVRCFYQLTMFWRLLRLQWRPLPQYVSLLYFFKIYLFKILSDKFVYFYLKAFIIWWVIKFLKWAKSPESLIPIIVLSIITNVKITMTMDYSKDHRQPQSWEWPDLPPPASYHPVNRQCQSWWWWSCQQSRIHVARHNGRRRAKGSWLALSYPLVWVIRSFRLFISSSLVVILCSRTAIL